MPELPRRLRTGKRGREQAAGSTARDSSEILQDLAAIAEADHDDLVEDEESEKNYAELTEYIRFAALNAYADSAPQDPGAAGSGSGVLGLH